MQIKFIKEVVNILVGKPAEDMVDLLAGKNNINEFLIAKKLDLTINQTRNILYKLSDYGLVSSIRKKDKKKGWYTYFWKIETIKMLEFLRNELIKKIQQLDNQIKSRETKMFYVCNRCNIELTEETALLHEFTCNECGDVFTLKDNSKMLKELKKAKDKFQNDLEEIEKDIELEKEKEEKKKAKEMKKEEKSSKKVKKKIKKEQKKDSIKKEKKKIVKKKPVKKMIKKVIKKKPVKKKVVKKKVSKTKKKSTRKK